MKHYKHYYRTITELLPSYSLVFLLVSLFVLCLYVFFSFSYYSKTREEWLKTRDNFAYWEEVAARQSNSPDAYYQAGLYAVQLHDNAAAMKLLDKAIQLDPGFTKAKELHREILETRY